MINQIYALKNLRPIILLSHMRANTSLFGHILGNNPDINGYYEMHISYFSWKSLIRQKLKFLEEHVFKRNSKYIFDKILHNEHYVNLELLTNKQAFIIISLRPPEETIPSIVKLYKKTDPSHEFSTVEGATNYYHNRLNTLAEYSNALKNQFIYIDANAIKHQTKDAFFFLEQHLNLKKNLSSNYTIQTKTGKGTAGDPSESLQQGKIIHTQNNYSDINLDKVILDEQTKHFIKTRELIVLNSKKYLQ